MHTHLPSREQHHARPVCNTGAAFSLSQLQQSQTGPVRAEPSHARPLEPAAGPPVTAAAGGAPQRRGGTGAAAARARGLAPAPANGRGRLRDRAAIPATRRPSRYLSAPPPAASTPGQPACPAERRRPRCPPLSAPHSPSRRWVPEASAQPAGSRSLRLPLFFFFFFLPFPPPSRCLLPPPTWK